MEKNITTRKKIYNNKQIKVNLVFNEMSKDIANKFVTQVKNYYVENTTSDIKKVG